jgi:hypothetical protein
VTPDVGKVAFGVYPQQPAQVVASITASLLGAGLEANPVPFGSRSQIMALEIYKAVLQGLKEGFDLLGAHGSAEATHA